jgi:polyhydroxyalkanoate synthesis regulator phasin
VATATNIAKQAVQDKIESQVKAVEAKLETLRLKADAAKKIAEVKAIADLVTKKHEIDRKLSDLKKSNESTYQQAKADIESRVAELEKSVKAIEAKFKTA